jgi:hypothetical protein
MRICLNLENKIFDNNMDYDRILQDCRVGISKQKLVYQGVTPTDQLWGFPVNYSHSFAPMFFDPWTGHWIKESYTSCYYSASSNQHKDHKKHANICEDEFNTDTECRERLHEKEWFFKEIEEDRAIHSRERYCASLEDLTRYSSRYDTSLIEIRNIRVIAVLNKIEYGGWSDDRFELFSDRSGYQGLEEWEFEGWTPMDYCPFCGAKLPERLDKKIIEVLRDEHGLTSWKDYKKAPHEFHTDEWWRKRGL